MGSTNKTTNYELSQYIGTDKPSWLTDYNNDMLKIDTQMKVNATAAGNAQTTANSADGKADANALAISTLDTQINTPTTGLAAIVSGHSTDISAINGTIGNTALPTTAQTLTGAVAELDSTKIDASALSSILKYSGEKVFTETFDGTKTYGVMMNNVFQQLLTYLATKDSNYRFRFMVFTPSSGVVTPFPSFYDVGNRLLPASYSNGVVICGSFTDTVHQMYLGSSGSYWKYTAFDPNNITNNRDIVADHNVVLTIEEYTY